MSELSEHIRNEDSRLDRIEMKIDKLTDAMIVIARAEQKIINIESQQAVAHERMNRHSAELDTVRSQQIKNTHTINLITFVVGAIFTSLVGVVAKMFF